MVSSRARLLWALVCVLVLTGCGESDLVTRAEPSLGSLFDASRRVEPALTRAVAAMAGRPIEVRCWPGGEWEPFAEEAARENGVSQASHILGVADGATTTIHLAPRVCQLLSAFVLEPDIPPPGLESVELVQALVTVGHEAGHLTSGFEPEYAAECFGLQHLSAVAQALGTSEAEGDLLAQFYWIEVFPYVDEIYHSPDCREGGPLDVDPSPIWP